MLQFFSSTEHSAALQAAFRRWPARRATLDLDFINERGWRNGVAGGVFDGIATVRNTTATFFDASGDIQTAAINTPRIRFDPATRWKEGLVLDPQRANLYLNSLIDKTPLVSQDATVTAAAHTVSFYGTGTIVLSGAFNATLTGLSATDRVSLTFTPSAGTLTSTVTGSVFWAQLEAGDSASSFIPTAGSPLSRSADILTMTGADFTDWYQQSPQGTFLMECLPRTLVQAESASVQSMLRINTSAGVNASNCIVKVGNVNVVTMVAPNNTVFPGQPTTIGFTFRSGANGSAVNADNILTSAVEYVMPTDFDKLRIGSSNATTVPSPGVLRRLIYIPEALSLDKLVELTQ